MCRAPNDAAVSAIMAHVDALLAQKGLLDRSSCLFRGCSVCIVRLPEPEQAEAAGEGTELLSCALHMRAAAEASRRRLAPWDAKQLALQVQLPHTAHKLPSGCSLFEEGLEAAPCTMHIGDPFPANWHMTGPISCCLGADCNWHINNCCSAVQIADRPCIHSMSRCADNLASIGR